MHRLHDEAGVGLVSSVAGIIVFLAFLLFAAQVLVHLFATSYVNAAAFDAARLASGSAGNAVQAREHGMDVLGGFAGRVSTFDVAVGAQSVTVHVQARSPALLPATFGRVFNTSSIDRRVTLRRELPRCAGC